MLQFIIKLITFSLPIIGILILMELNIRKIPNDYIYKKNYLELNSKKIKVLFLGSSHTYYGINPIYLNDSSFNCALVSQSLNIDYEILKKSVHKLTNLKIVVIPIDYLTMFNTIENTIEKWRLKNYNLYFGLNLKNSKIDLEIIDNNFKSNINQILNYKFHNKTNLSCNTLGFGTKYNSKLQQDMNISGITAIKRHTSSKFTNNFIFNRNADFLNKIYKITHSKKIKLIIISCPTYKTYYDKMNTKQFLLTLKFISIFCKSRTDVIYLNFMKDLNFTKKDFYDADHLNEIGSKKLTLKVKKSIIEL